MNKNENIDGLDKDLQLQINLIKQKMLDNKSVYRDEKNTIKSYKNIKEIDKLNSSKNKLDVLDETKLEMLLSTKNIRYTIFPIKYKDIWDMYKKQQSCFWKTEEIDLSNDYNDFIKLSHDEQHFIKMILAFFAASDGIVNFNLRERFLKEVTLMEAQVVYGFQMMMENIHCVSGSTKILTSNGYITIGDNIDKEVEVFNGESFSKTTIRFTGKSNLYKVKLSNGMELDCTPNHKWFIIDDNSGEIVKKELINIKVGDIIDTAYAFPILDIEDQIIYDDYEVPINASINSKMRWLEDICDHNYNTSKSNSNSNSTYISIYSDDYDFMHNVQLLFTTLGMNISIHTIGDIHHEIKINQWCLSNLATLGFPCNKYKLMETINSNNNGDYCCDNVSIIAIIPLEGIHDTYCFNEPIRHAGIFNGILTGQSETYSLMLEKIVKDPKERSILFNAIENIPSVKNMADWAFKWIDSPKRFAYRIVAFAIVEGIFFSGAFAAIYWLKKYRNGGQHMMNGLIKSNEFICRDETLHCEFACLLYKYVNQKLNEKDIYEMMDDAIGISKKFTDDAIPCKMIGMNNDIMGEYIEYVADRLLVALGYNKKYNAQNPFNFMETIGLSNKTSFFETRPTTYQSAHNQNNKITREIVLLDMF